MDFGATASRERTFDVAVPGALTSQRVVAAASLNMPPGVAADELEMDMLICAAGIVSNDSVRLTVASLSTGITGQRNINLTIG